MKLNFQAYKDKVYACWIGKNIGGTIGTPYEGQRKMHDIQGFATAANVVLPNDDLDLQLVWLMAVERSGISKIDACTLGEYWLSYITPHWNEYGIGKANMKLGIQPPISGESFNTWKHSNGAWIRTEIWACLAPACPDVAMKYAYEGACVDHGTSDGTTAAMFVAAIESAAFVENDIRKLLEIGLSKIPADCRLYKSVRILMDCYDKGLDYKAAREAIFRSNADLGDGWFEAPSNVAYAMLGLLYGEGDFKKSIIYAVNCGDDTDCTGATVGSILGIMGGTAGIPEDWKAHIGDAISTISIGVGRIDNQTVPKTCTQLTEQVIAQAPRVLAYNGADVSFTDGADEIPADIYEKILADNSFAKDLCARKEYTFRTDFAYASCYMTLEGDPKIQAGGSFKVHARFVSNYHEFACPPYLLKFRWLLPEGFTVKGPKSVILPEFNSHYNAQIEVDFEIIAPENPEAINRCVLEALADGRFTAGYMPITLLA